MPAKRIDPAILPGARIGKIETLPAAELATHAKEHRAPAATGRAQDPGPFPAKVTGGDVEGHGFLDRYPVLAPALDAVAQRERVPLLAAHVRDMLVALERNGFVSFG